VGKLRSVLSRRISWEPSTHCQCIAPSTGLLALRGARPRGPVSPCSVLRAHLVPSASGLRVSQPAFASATFGRQRTCLGEARLRAAGHSGALIWLGNTTLCG
jgi:hypothetical protein